MEQNFNTKPIEKTLADLWLLIETIEKKILLAQSSKSLSIENLKKNQSELEKLKNTFSELQLFVQESYLQMMEVEQNGIRIGFHRGRNSAIEEMLGGSPDFNKTEEYRHFNTLKTINKWPDLY